MARKAARAATKRGGPRNTAAEGRTGEVRDYFLERLVMLSDGVFAVAITLTAIEIHPPRDWDGSWMGLWQGSWQTMGAYFVSFAAVGAFWIGHRRAFRPMQRADTPLTLLNLLVLALIALAPAGAQLIYEYGPHGVALQTYVGLIGAVGVAQALMWGYAALIGRLIHEQIPTSLRIATFLIMLFAPVITVGSILYSLTTRTWWAAVLGLAVIVVMDRVRRRLAAQVGAPAPRAAA